MFVMSTGPYITKGGPQSASDIGTPGTPQIASVLGTGGLKIGGSPYHFYTGPLFSTTLVMIVLFINIIAINVVMIITIFMVIN